MGRRRRPTFFNITSMQTENLEIYNETNTQTPDLDFLGLKNEILGEGFSLSLSILKGVNSKKVNKKQRNKTYTPNTLSFLYSADSGEIIITPEIVEKEMFDFDHTYEEHFLFLFIHSLLHLKGHDHGEDMEKLEQKYLKKYTK